MENKGRPKYYNPSDEKIEKIRQINLERAREAGLTVDEWHKEMSEIGNAPLIVAMQELTNEQIAINSAREIGWQNRKKWRGWFRS